MPDPDYTHRLERTLQVCKTLPSSLQLEPLLQSITASAAELVLSEEASILLYDKEQHCLRFVAAPALQMPTLKNLGVPVDRSVAGWVYTNARPAQLDDASGDERIFRVVDREVSDKTHSLLAVPLIYQGETIGVLEAVNKHNNAHYTGEDLLILETLASQAAFAIQNQNRIDQFIKVQQHSLEMDQLKSDWVAIVSQELRRTLNNILLQAADLSGDDAPVNAARLAPILDATSRLQQVAIQLDSLENFEKALAHMQIEKVEVLPLVQKVVESFQETAAARKITLLMDVPEGLVFNGDATKIAIALRNLIENAISFTYENGWVRVRAEALPEFVKFTVIDRGVGIAEQDQRRIFERFYQGKPQPARHQGAGLGLSIAREMVEAHGGEIWVESEDGLGSTFAFMIPS